jgi:nicotinate-nucleotide adenylyltransferase
MDRIGIFGGTFNPVHIAHLIAAEEVKQQMHLNKVIFIPSADPPHKDGHSLVKAHKRLEMLNLAIKDNPSFESSDIEIRISENSKSYTVNTLMALRELHKDEPVKFFLIIGMDQLIELHTWRDPGKLFVLSEVVVINRPGYFAHEVANDFSGRVHYLPIPSMEISSTDIRHRINELRPIRYMVGAEVEKYIIKNNLYKI